MAVCSEIHTKHIIHCGQNVELLNVKLAVYEVTTGLRGSRKENDLSGAAVLVTKLHQIRSFDRELFRRAGAR